MPEHPPEKIGFVDEVRRYLRANPFVPFEIVTGSDRHPITYSHQVAISDDSLYALLPDRGITRIKKDGIVGVHVIEPANGKVDHELRRHLLAKPFAPFEIITNDGDQLNITYRLQMAIGENAIIALMPKRGITRVGKNQIATIRVPESG